MKSYTDIEQSKKLAKILPLESADMGWNVFVDDTKRPLPIDDWDLVKDGSGNVKFYPAWSLAALLSAIPIVTLSEFNGTWSCDSYIKDGLSRHTHIFGKITGDPIDTCVEMIIKLHEQNIL